MTPQTLLRHLDEGQLWPDEALAGISADVGVAYACGTPIIVIGQPGDVLQAKNEKHEAFKKISLCLKYHVTINKNQRDSFFQFWK